MWLQLADGEISSGGEAADERLVRHHGPGSARGASRALYGSYCRSLACALASEGRCRAFEAPPVAAVAASAPTLKNPNTRRLAPSTAPLSTDTWTGDDDDTAAEQPAGPGIVVAPADVAPARLVRNMFVSHSRVLSDRISPRCTAANTAYARTQSSANTSSRTRKSSPRTPNSTSAFPRAPEPATRRLNSFNYARREKADLQSQLALMRVERLSLMGSNLNLNIQLESLRKKLERALDRERSLAEQNERLKRQRAAAVDPEQFEVSALLEAIEERKSSHARTGPGDAARLGRSDRRPAGVRPRPPSRRRSRSPRIVSTEVKQLSQ